MDYYTTPSHSQLFELEIKRSRFITCFEHCQDRGSAKRQISAIAQRYADASHHCWAVIIGSPYEQPSMDQSDDGEPKGSAGKPMLKVLQHTGMGDTLVVVSRYFGGIKLGIGGLTRAYSQAVSSAVSELKTDTQFLRAPLCFQIDYHQLPRVEHWLNRRDISIVAKQFDTDVTLQLAVPQRQLADIKTALVGLTNANLRVLDSPDIS